MTRGLDGQASLAIRYIGPRGAKQCRGRLLPAPSARDDGALRARARQSRDALRGDRRRGDCGAHPPARSERAGGVGRADRLISTAGRALHRGLALAVARMSQPPASLRRGRALLSRFFSTRGLVSSPVRAASPHRCPIRRRRELRWPGWNRNTDGCRHAKARRATVPDPDR